MTVRPRDRVALIALLFLAVIGAYYMLALKPERQKAAALQASISQQQQTLTQAQQSFNAGRAAASSLKANEAQWAALQLAVPAQSNIPGLLRTLEKTAHSAGVQMQAISLSAASTGSTTSTGSTSTTGPAGATAVPIQLTFNGGYVALNHLVQRLNALVTLAGGKVHATGPLMSIGTVSLSGAPKLNVQMSASIYQLQTPPTTTGGQS